MKGRPVKIKKYVIVLSWIILITGVVLTSGCRKGLHRNSLEKWENVRFPTMGIEMEVPVDRELQEISDNEAYRKNAECVSMFFEMHPVYTGTLSDTPHLINCTVSVLNKNNYSQYLSNKHLLSNVGIFDDKTFNSEITEYSFPSTRSINFRKDVKSKSGNVALCSITYRDKNSENQQYKEQDIEAIKRMLNSIKLIGDDTAKADVKNEAKPEAGKKDTPAK